MSIDELLDTLFESRAHALAPTVAAWLASSRRFVRFARDHETKIRKKLRAVQDPESVRDLHLELETAYQLTLAKAFTPMYEPATGTPRGPDFAVRFTTSLEFMVEVTRVRADQDASAVPESGRPASIDDGLGRDAGDALSDRRLAGVLASKLGQTVVGHANLLIVGLDGLPPSADELDASIRRIRRHVEVNGVDALRRQRFAGRGDYVRRAGALSAILVRPAPGPPGEPRGLPEPQVTFWSNPQAAVPLPSKVRSAVLQAVATTTDARQQEDGRT